MGAMLLGMVIAVLAFLTVVVVKRPKLAEMWISKFLQSDIRLGNLVSLSTRMREDDDDSLEQLDQDDDDSERTIGPE